MWAVGRGVFGIYDAAAAAERCLGYGPTVLHAVGRERSGRTASLPKPVVETLSVARVREWATAEAKAVLDVVLSWSVFRQQVIAPGHHGLGVASSLGRLLSVAPSRLRELRLFHYIRRLRSPPRWGVLCPVFFVPKDDLSDRMIYDGRGLNERCRRPPRLSFVPLHRMLRRITRPGVRLFLAYDFATFFVQFRVHPSVQSVFAARTRDGAWWRVTGVPMGWSWSPLLAQTVAETLAAEALRRFGDPTAHVFVYIDNVLFFFEGDGLSVRERAKRLDRVFRQVCCESGAVLKESASVLGTSVDWLGVRVTAGCRACNFRDRFVEKVRVVRDTLAAGVGSEVRFLWRSIALAVRALWVAGKPLALLRDPLRFLVHTARRLNKGSIAWGTRLLLWRDAQEQLSAVFRWVSGGGVFRVWEPDSRVLGVGVSDAAGGTGGHAGYVFRCGRRVVAARWVPSEATINGREFEALETGLVDVMAETHVSGTLYWGSDNTTAIAWSGASWSVEAGRCARAMRRWSLAERRRVDVSVVKVPGGGENPADVLTRVDERAPALCSGASWRVVFEVSCECGAICGEVSSRLRRLIGLPAWAAVPSLVVPSRVSTAAGAFSSRSRTVSSARCARARQASEFPGSLKRDRSPDSKEGREGKVLCRGGTCRGPLTV